MMHRQRTRGTASSRWVAGSCYAAPNHLLSDLRYRIPELPFLPADALKLSSGALRAVRRIQQDDPAWWAACATLPCTPVGWYGLLRSWLLRVNHLWFPIHCYLLSNPTDPHEARFHAPQQPERVWLELRTLIDDSLNLCLDGYGIGLWGLLHDWQHIDPDIEWDDEEDPEEIITWGDRRTPYLSDDWFQDAWTLTLWHLLADTNWGIGIPIEGLARQWHHWDLLKLLQATPTLPPGTRIDVVCERMEVVLVEDRQGNQLQTPLGTLLKYAVAQTDNPLANQRGDEIEQINNGALYDPANDRTIDPWAERGQMRVWAQRAQVIATDYARWSDRAKWNYATSLEELLRHLATATDVSDTGRAANQVEPSTAA